MDPLFSLAQDGKANELKHALGKDEKQVETVNSKGQTLLIMAAIAGHAEVCEVIMGFKMGKGMVDAQDQEGLTVSRSSTRRRRTRRQKLVNLSYEPLPFVARQALHHASINDNVSVIKYLCHHGASDIRDFHKGWAPFQWALHKSSHHSVIYYLQHPPMGGKKCPPGTINHYTCAKAMLAYSHAIRVGDVGLLMALIKAGIQHHDLQVTWSGDDVKTSVSFHAHSLII